MAEKHGDPHGTLSFPPYMDGSCARVSCVLPKFSYPLRTCELTWKYGLCRCHIKLRYSHTGLRASLVAQRIKRLPAMQET